MRFVLNPDKLETLYKLRGWKSHADLARALKLTRSYVRRVLIGQERMSDYFMLGYIKISGADPDSPKEWGSLFIPDLRQNEAQEVFNYMKLRGQVPYKALSLSAEFRKQDNPALEQEEVSAVD